MKSEPSPVTETEPGNAPVKPMLHAEHLEQLIDAYGLSRMLATFSEIAYEKADHIQTNWQDKALSDKWVKAAVQCEKLSEQFTGL